MASVRKRILPSGETRWQVDYKSQDGSRRSRQFRTRKEATAYETQVRGEVAHGVHVPDSVSVTVECVAELWIEAGQADGLEATTIRQRDQHIRLHIVPLIGTVKLSQLTGPKVEAFKDELVKTRSRALARAVLTSLKGILKLARRRCLIIQNPAEGIAVDKRRHEDEEDAPIPPKAYIRDMVLKAGELFPLARQSQGRWIAGQGRPQHTVAVPWRPLLMMAIFTGMRASELRGLRWPNVDLKAGVVRVRERADRYQRLGPPKSKAGRRDIPLAPLVTNTLREWQLACPPTDLDLVFPSESGAVILHTNLLRQGFYPVLKACELMAADATEPPYSFHSLHHAAASLFIEQGWNPKKI